jgi:hypothetical protein
VSTATLHPRLAPLVELLTSAREQLMAVLETVPSDLAGRRPQPECWSVAQIADHLRLVEGGVGRALGRLAREADSLGPETETTSVLGALDRHQMAERLRRIEAPGTVAPGEDPDLEAAIAALRESRRRLLDLVQRVNGRALGRLSFPHPVLGTLTFYEWLLFLGQHERRHTTQAREVLGMLRKLGLALLATTVVTESAGAQQPAAALPYPAMAARIVSALQPAVGERAILRTDSIAMPALIGPVRAALEKAGVEVSVLGFGPGVDLAGELGRSTIYLYLPLAPETTLSSSEAALLGKWLDSGKGREVHFHWTGITTATDGLPIEVPPDFDRLHLAALDANEGALRHRLTRASELLRGREIRVATPAGTDLRFRIGDRPICLQDGNASQAAVAGKPLRIDKEIELPAGALRVAPIEETVSGTMVIPMLRVGDDTARMVQLDFAGGRVTDVRAEAGLQAVQGLLAKSPALARFRELGIGFNPALAVPASQPAIPYAGYGAGMVRLSLGDNSELGGRVSGGDLRWLFFPDATVTAGPAILVAGGRLAI